MSRSIPSAAPPVSVLMYHQVGPFASPVSHRAGYCHVRRFGAQMAWLRRFGYHVIGLDWLLGGQTRAALVDADTVRALHARRVTFGSHAFSHPRLSRLVERARAA